MLKKVEGLKPIADELGVPLAQLAIAWCATNPNVSSVITGATKESQVSFKNIISFYFYFLRSKNIISSKHIVVTRYAAFFDVACVCSSFYFKKRRLKVRFIFWMNEMTFID